MGSEGTTVAALAVDGYPRNVPHAGKTSENSKWHAEGTAPLQPSNFRGITRLLTNTGTSKGSSLLASGNYLAAPLIRESSRVRGVFYFTRLRASSLGCDCASCSEHVVGDGYGEGVT